MAAYNIKATLASLLNIDTAMPLPHSMGVSKSMLGKLARTTPETTMQNKRPEMTSSQHHSSRNCIDHKTIKQKLLGHPIEERQVMIGILVCKNSRQT